MHLAKARERLRRDRGRCQHALDELLEPFFLVHPRVRVGPDAEFFDVVEIDRRPSLRIGGQAFDEPHRFAGRREWNAITQRFGDREQIQHAAVFFRRVVAGEILGALARAQKMVVVDRDETDSGIGQRRHQRRFPDALGQPRALGTLMRETRQAIRQCVDLADAIARRNYDEHRFHIAAAEYLYLAALHHLAQQRHVVRILVEQILQQPAAEMHGKPKAGIAMQGVQKRPVATRMRIVQHLGKIPDRLVRVDAEQ